MIKFILVIFLLYILFQKIYSVFKKRQNFKNKDVIYKFKVQLAKNDFERTTGLIYLKKPLKHKTGMLFDFKKNIYPNLTMKKTKIPLDAIFIDSHGKAVFLISNMKPYSKKAYKSNKLCRYVLEVNAGTIKKLNINIGDYISTTLLDKKITNFKKN